MSFNHQILQQVQDSVVPSPILVIPIKPVVTDTNLSNDKNTSQTKKENQNVKNTISKNTSEKTVVKTQPSVEIIKETVSSVTKVDTLTQVNKSDSTSIYTSKSVSGYTKALIKDTITPIQYRRSLFTEHELKVNYLEPKERKQTYSDWVIGTFFFISLLLLLNKILNPKKWSQQLKIIFSKKAFEQLLRDEKDFRSPFLFIQFIASSLTISLFIYQLFFIKALINNEESEYYLYIKILLAVIGLIIIYFVSQKIAGFILEKSKVVSEYFLSTLLLFNITGTFLLPLSIGLAYVHDIPTNVILNTGIAFLGFAFLFKLYKGLTIASSYNSLHLFYLFLYICTLEILPVAIAVKFISNNL